MESMPWDLLADLSEDDKRRLVRSATRRRYRKGETLFHEGDPADTMHLVVSGRVQIRATAPTGDVLTLTILGPGDALGEQAMLDPGKRRTASAVACEASQTLAIDYPTFAELLHDHPEVQAVLVRILSRRVTRLSDQVRDALFVSADLRVLRQVRRLVDLYDDGDGDPVTIGLTQADVASLAGTTRSTANRALRDAVAAGIIELARGRIVVNDRDAVERLGR